MTNNANLNTNPGVDKGGPGPPPIACKQNLRGGRYTQTFSVA